MLRFTAVALAAVLLPGCSKSDELPNITGKVLLDGQPLANASVEFFPLGDTRGLGGTAQTDDQGAFTLSPKRGKGILPGEYRVIISKRQRPDGSAPPPDQPPIESDASEVVPADYSDREGSKLRAQVSKEQTTFEFNLDKAAGP